MSKVNNNYTFEQYTEFSTKLIMQIMLVANEAILYASRKDMYGAFVAAKTSEKLQEAIEKAENIIFHEADYIFLKEDDKK